jgi:hypothetical protein
MGSTAALLAEAVICDSIPNSSLPASTTLSVPLTILIPSLTLLLRFLMLQLG